MNFLIVTDSMAAGGSLTYILNLVHELNNQKHQLTIITFGNHNFKIKDLFNPKLVKHLNVEVNNSHSLKSLPTKFIRLFRLLYQNHQHYDIIISDLIPPSLILIALKKLLDCTKNALHYYQFHGSTVLEKKSADEFTNPFIGRAKESVHHFLEQLVFSQVNSIFVFSDYSHRLLTTNYKKLPPIIKTSPGIDYRLSPDIRNISKSTAKIKLGFDPKTPIFLLVTRIDKRKGIEPALINFQKYYHGNAQIIIASNFDEPYFNIFPTISRLGLGTRVKIINSPSPFQRSLLYRAATAFMMTSLDLETFGFVTLESLYFNTPVVGFNIGANPETIHSQFLFPKYNWSKYFTKLTSISKARTPKFPIIFPLLDTWHKYVYDITFLSTNKSEKVN